MQPGRRMHVAALPTKATQLAAAAGHSRSRDDEGHCAALAALLEVRGDIQAVGARVDDANVPTGNGLQRPLAVVPLREDRREGAGPGGNKVLDLRMADNDHRGAARAGEGESEAGQRYRGQKRGSRDRHSREVPPTARRVSV